MKRKINCPDSSDEDSKTSNKKAKQEKNGKRKMTDASDSKETGDGSYRACSSGQNIRDNDCDKGFNCGAGGSSKEIAEMNFSFELHSGTEINDIDLDFIIWAITDGELHGSFNISFCCARSAYNYLLENIDTGSQRVRCNCQRGQDRNEEADRGDASSGSSKMFGESSHSRERQSFYETYMIEQNVESYGTATGGTFNERCRCDGRDISREFHSYARIASDLNVGNRETVEDDEMIKVIGSDSSYQGSESEDKRCGCDGRDISREFHSDASTASDLNVGYHETVEDDEVIEVIGSDSSNKGGESEDNQSSDEADTNEQNAANRSPSGINESPERMEGSLGSNYEESFLSGAASDGQNAEDSEDAENNEAIEEVENDDSPDPDGADSYTTEESEWSTNYESSESEDEGYVTGENSSSDTEGEGHGGIND